MCNGGFLYGADRCAVAEGELRLLSAREVLEARREGEQLAAEGREKALCANACLIAKALERGVLLCPGSDSGAVGVPHGDGILAEYRLLGGEVSVLNHNARRLAARFSCEN